MKKHESNNGVNSIARIYICSPLRAATPQLVENNRKRARLFIEKAIRNFRNIAGNGEHQQFRAFAPHAYISYMLDDSYPCERELALEAGLGILNICDLIAIGGTVLSEGMIGEIKHAALVKQLPIFLLGEPDKPLDHLSRHELCLHIGKNVFANDQATKINELDIYDLSSKISDQKISCIHLTPAGGFRETCMPARDTIKTIF